MLRYLLFAIVIMAAACGLGAWEYWGHYLPAQRDAEGGVILPENVTAYQTTDRITVFLRLGNPTGKHLRGDLLVELVDADGRVFLERLKSIYQTAPWEKQRIELSTPFLARYIDGATLRCTLGDAQMSVPLEKVLAVRAHESSLDLDREFLAGSTAALLCDVHSVQSIWSAPGISDAKVNVTLRGDDGASYPLHSGRTGSNGWEAPQFEVPKVPPGPYTVQITTQSQFGKEVREYPVTVANRARVRLVTDRSDYKPGDVIHATALVTQPFDEKPIAGVGVMFRMIAGPSQSGDVKSALTGPNGIAKADIHLPDDATEGEWSLNTATDQGGGVPHTIVVHRPVSPTFRLSLTADKSFYAPTDAMLARVTAFSNAGRPMSAVSVKVSACRSGDPTGAVEKWSVKTDAMGTATIGVPLKWLLDPSPRSGEPTKIRMHAEATDSDGNKESAERLVPVSAQPFNIWLIPDGGRLVPEMENRVYVVSAYPDGRPSPCSLLVRLGQEPTGRVLTGVETDVNGIGEFRFTPNANYVRSMQFTTTSPDILGDSQPLDVQAPRYFDLEAEGTDQQGHTARLPAVLPCRPAGADLLLQIDRSVYRVGDSMNVVIQGSSSATPVSLRFVQAGQTVNAQRVSIVNGRAESHFEVPRMLLGAVEIHVLQILKNGPMLRDSRVIYVQPSKEAPNPWSFGAGDHGFTDAGPLRYLPPPLAARGATGGGTMLIQESAHRLDTLPKGLPTVFNALARRLGAAAKDRRASHSLSLLPVDPVDEVRCERMAAALLGSIQPRPNEQWIIHPALDRLQRFEKQIRQVGKAVFRYASDSKPFMEYQSSARRWTFRPNLLEEMIGAGFIDRSLLDAPFGEQLTLDDMLRLDASANAERLAEVVTWYRFQQLVRATMHYAFSRQHEFLREGQWRLSETVLADVVRTEHVNPRCLMDTYGLPIRLTYRNNKRVKKGERSPFDDYEFVSVGPDRVFGTSDDLRQTNELQRERLGKAWLGLASGIVLDDRLTNDPLPAVHVASPPKAKATKEPLQLP